MAKNENTTHYTIKRLVKNKVCKSQKYSLKQMQRDDTICTMPFLIA